MRTEYRKLLSLGKPPQIDGQGIWILGIAHKRGGDFNACPDGLEKNFPSSNGHLLGFGGV